MQYAQSSIHERINAKANRLVLIGGPVNLKFVSGKDTDAYNGSRLMLGRETLSQYNLNRAEAAYDRFVNNGENY